MISLVVSGDFDEWGTPPALQLVVPGSHSFELTDTGEYYLYHEYLVEVDSIDYSIDSIPYALGFTLRKGGDSSIIRLETPDYQTSYSYPGRAGASLLQFEVKALGLYELDVGYDNGETAPDLVIAIGTATRFDGLTPGLAVFVIVWLAVLMFSILLWRVKFSETADPRNR